MFAIECAYNDGHVDKSKKQSVIESRMRNADTTLFTVYSESGTEKNAVYSEKSLSYID